jgi:hypothetical protein
VPQLGFERDLWQSFPYWSWAELMKKLSAPLIYTVMLSSPGPAAHSMLTGKALVLAPLAASAPAETHAALVVSQAAFTEIRFGADFTTISQLRTGSTPNPWECAWAIFSYTDNQHFYYVAFKPTGWELGKLDLAYPGAQRFLATGSEMTFPVGVEHRFDIRQAGATITVAVDGMVLATFTDLERPYLGGKIGFYTEDARVVFDNVTGSVSETFENYPTQALGDGGTLGGTWEVPFVGYGSVEVAVL